MPLDRAERRLSAILSADVVGYSRLMAADEQATVRTITAYRNEISNLVGDHRGRVVDATGDNSLAEFPTALDAVECAVEIQRVLRARNEGLSEERRMEFRIGVHLGDVTVEGDRIYGDGVNIAARLQGLAEAGGICVSGAVWEQVESKLGLPGEDLGEQAVKNIAKPVRVFRVSIERTSAPRPVTDKPSIVVLPFADMSPEKDQEYFCDGMAEEVINALTQLEGLHVVARTSAFSFKGRDVDVRKIGRELGVRSVLEGSVRKAGDRLRITAQLISVEDGYHLWSDRFDRQLDDVFAIQDEISSKIVEVLKVKLAVRSVLQTTNRTEKHEAYDLYLRGMHHFWVHTKEPLSKAMECFEKALVVDPHYAAAHAGIAHCCVLLSIFGFVDAKSAMNRAELAAGRALELDDGLAEAHSAVGFVSAWRNWDWNRAERELRRAIELNPGSATARVHLVASGLIFVGRTREGVAEMRQAHGLDPLSISVNYYLGGALYWDRQFDAAIRQLRHTIEMGPDLHLGRNWLAAAYSSNGMPEEAVGERIEILLQTGREKEAQELSEAFSEGGEPRTLRWFIKRGLLLAEKEGVEGRGGNRALNMALLYSRLGELEESLRWLEEAVRRREVQAIYAKVHPWFDSLRSDPRYGETLKTMGLDD